MRTHRVSSAWFGSPLQPTACTTWPRAFMASIDTRRRRTCTFCGTEGPSSAGPSTRTAAAPYSTSSLAPLAGDTIDFAVGWGSDQTFDYDTTGLSATITP